tara:strand:+ start:16380 stop:17036 length:657 start_codon:yes stop_codon:yes gene_type:complete
MTTLVTTLIDSVKTTLQETTDDGVRWKNDELISYLNDASRFLAENEPDAYAANVTFECVTGTKQTIPDNSTRLLDVVRNLDGKKWAVSVVDKNTLNSARPNWHAENPTNQQELFYSDDRNPKQFYVYPPATQGSLLETVLSLEPVRHLPKESQDKISLLQVNDRYVPALMNYILFRAFDKDSDTGGNYQRSQGYLQGAYNSLGIKMQNTARISPNTQG